MHRTCTTARPLRVKKLPLHSIARSCVGLTSPSIGRFKKNFQQDVVIDPSYRNRVAIQPREVLGYLYCSRGLVTQWRFVTGGADRRFLCGVNNIFAERHIRCAIINSNNRCTREWSSTLIDLTSDLHYIRAYTMAPCTICINLYKLTLALIHEL